VAARLRNQPRRRKLRTRQRSIRRARPRLTDFDEAFWAPRTKQRGERRRRRI